MIGYLFIYWIFDSSLEYFCTWFSKILSHFSVWLLVWLHTSCNKYRSVISINVWYVLKTLNTTITQVNWVINTILIQIHELYHCIFLVRRCTYHMCSHISDLIYKEIPLLHSSSVWPCCRCIVNTFLSGYFDAKTRFNRNIWLLLLLWSGSRENHERNLWGWKWKILLYNVPCILSVHYQCIVCQR